jgi:hypothetical protein
MNDKQPEALQLADAMSDPKTWSNLLVIFSAAQELRRLHQVEKERDELLYALKLCRAELVKLTQSSDAIIRAREQASQEKRVKPN